MEEILDLPVEQQRTMNYAGFGSRFGAAIIDGIILSVVQFILQLALSNVPVVGTIISLITGILYAGYFESSENQATPGKMAVGIKVVGLNGERISFANAVGRYLAKILSTLIIFIGYLMVLWDEKKQGLHDKLAGTYVIDGK